MGGSAPAIETNRPAVLSARGLMKSFFGVRVLHGIDLEVDRGEVLGLVGENGSGKSTSMNILAGVLKPDAGEMFLGGTAYAPQSPRAASDAGIAFIHQELNLFPNLTIAENLFIDRFPRRSRVPLIDRRQVNEHTRRLLKDVELDLAPQTPVARLSQGEKQLVEIAKALSVNARIIIFDEPTTSLTRHEIDRLFAIIRRLKERGIAMIYISHALEDVMSVCDTIMVLRDGAMVGRSRRADITTARIITLMVGRSIDTIYPERKFRPRKAEALAIEGLSQPGVAENMSFTVHAGEIVGLAGLMGSGRSELARMIFGIDPFQRGRITVAGKPVVKPTPARAMSAGLAFLTEDRRGDGLLMDFSIGDNMILASLSRFAQTAGIINRSSAVEEARIMANRVHLSTDRVATVAVKHLSGGNQQKVVIGKWLMRTPKVFILDEPTRGIDVGAKQEVYRIIVALVESGSAVLLISSEIEELIGLSDRILTINKGELTGMFERSAFDREALMAAATQSGERRGV